jgi:hypothetical protein
MSNRCIYNVCMYIHVVLLYYYARVSDSARAYTAHTAAMLPQVEMRRWPQTTVRTYISIFLLMPCDSHRRNGRVGV